MSINIVYGKTVIMIAINSPPVCYTTAVSRFDKKKRVTEYLTTVIHYVGQCANCYHAKPK